jgi:two-component system, cell cycle response regulator DivK
VIILPPVTQTPLILVVDDVEDGRMLLTQILEHAGYRVAEASDGHQALERAHSLLPNLILMDLSLPGVDGWEVTRRLKQDDRTRHIPIVALSAHALKIHSDRASQVGAESFLSKPTMPDAIVAEVRRLLADGAPAAST